MGRMLRFAATCSWAAATVSVGALAVAVLCRIEVSVAAPQDRSYPPADFFAGDYLVVGQHPGGGSAYAGTAHIEAQGDDALMIARTIDGEVIRERAQFRSLEPLADAVVLDVHGLDGMIVASCLWTVDLDNYPRLTCVRASESGLREALGHEALFPAN